MASIHVSGSILFQASSSGISPARPKPAIFRPVPVKYIKAHYEKLVAKNHLLPLPFSPPFSHTFCGHVQSIYLDNDAQEPNYFTKQIFKNP